MIYVAAFTIGAALAAFAVATRSYLRARRVHTRAVAWLDESVARSSRPEPTIHTDRATNNHRET